MAAGSTLRKSAALAGNKSRVQGVTGAQTIKASAGVLTRVIVANADAAAQTLTVLDGATTLIVLRLPAGDSRALELGLPMTSSIVVTPSSINLDALIVWD